MILENGRFDFNELQNVIDVTVGKLDFPKNFFFSPLFIFLRIFTAFVFFQVFSLCLLKGFI